MDKNINTEPSAVEKVDLRHLRDDLFARLHKDIVCQFRGIPVMVDEELVGNSYYIAVSKELYDQIEQGNEEKSVVFPGGDGDRQICRQCSEDQRATCREEEDK